MGWTYTYACPPVDIKHECDRIIEKDPKLKVLKSTVRNKVHYAAVLDQNSGEIFATVFLTDVCDDDFNFGYKDMDETVGPLQTDCPASILDLLTFTDSEYALEWRQKCRDKIRRESERRRSLSILPIGTRIRTTVAGKEYILRKRAPNALFKSVWWHCEAENTYMQPKYIESFEII